MRERLDLPALIVLASGVSTIILGWRIDGALALQVAVGVPSAILLGRYARTLPVALAVALPLTVGLMAGVHAWRTPRRKLLAIAVAHRGHRTCVVRLADDALEVLDARTGEVLARDDLSYGPGHDPDSYRARGPSLWAPPLEVIEACEREGPAVECTLIAAGQLARLSIGGSQRLLDLRSGRSLPPVATVSPGGRWIARRRCHGWSIASTRTPSRLAFALAWRGRLRWPSDTRVELYRRRSPGTSIAFTIDPRTLAIRAHSRAGAERLARLPGCFERGSLCYELVLPYHWADEYARTRQLPPASPTEVRAAVDDSVLGSRAAALMPDGRLVEWDPRTGQVIARYRLPWPELWRQLGAITSAFALIALGLVAPRRPSV